MKRIVLLTLLATLALSCSDRYTTVGKPDLKISLDGSKFYVDEPLTFSFKGDADIISFWSGEEGNDYEWRATDRILQSEGVLSFGTAFQAGAQWKNQALPDEDSKLISFLWSDDFDGDYSIEGIGRAHWHAVTDSFTIASARVDNARLLNNATPSGDVYLKDLIPADAHLPLYFAFRYHIQAYYDSLANSRSRVAVSSFTIRGVNADLNMNEVLVNNSTAGWTLVSSGYADADKDYMPEVAPSYIWFDCSTSNRAERFCWAVSQAYNPDYSVNLGCDYAVGIKSFSDTPLNSYTYSYSKPGNYRVVFSSSNVASDGKASMALQSFDIEIVSRGSATVDNPEHKDW